MDPVTESAAGPPRSRPDDLEVTAADLRVGDRVVGFANCACEQRRTATKHGEYPVVAVENGYSVVTILGENRPWMSTADRTQRVWIRSRGVG